VSEPSTPGPVDRRDSPWSGDEPPKPIRGPELPPDSPDWLMLVPLSDTRRLSRGELLATDDPR